MQWSSRKGAEMSVLSCHSDRLRWGGQRGWRQTLSWLFAGMGWETAAVALTCTVLMEKLLCRSWRPRPEVLVPFLSLLGCVGMLSPRDWNWFCLPQWLCLGCHGLDFGRGWAVQPSGLRTGLGGWVPGGDSGSGGDAVQWLPVSFFFQFKLLKNKSLHSLNKLFTSAFQP